MDQVETERGGKVYTEGEWRESRDRVKRESVEVEMRQE